MEVWKDIKGYEGTYQVSSYGRVKSLKYGKERILKSRVNSYGYLHLNLCKNGKSYNKKIHRLIAEAFIPNPKNLPEINHKDENKLNNNIDNLEWCTHKYNTNYGTRTKRASEKTNKKVICINTKEIFKSIGEAAKYANVRQSGIVNCCRGRQKYSGKHPVTNEPLTWRYYNES